MCSIDEIKSMVNNINSNNITAPFMFAGSVATIEDLQKVKEPKHGKVYLCRDNNTTYVYIDSKFEPLCDADDIGNNTVLEEVIKKTKCDSCGAPLIISKHNKHMLECEYCGSKYPNV